MRKAGLDLLKAGTGEKILEIGFGAGNTLVALAKAVGPEGTVFGLDLSNHMMRLAKKRLSDSGLLARTRLRCGDAIQLVYSADARIETVRKRQIKNFLLTLLIYRFVWIAE